MGVDLRTVQLWFQENDKGISTANIRWLARVFGCDDPVATSEWQVELSAAQSRLTAKRREGKRAGSTVAPEVPEPEVPAVTAPSDEQIESPGELVPDAEATGPRRRFGLARQSEALFSRGSPLNLPALVFAGITALGFLSYIVGVHNVTYRREDGVVKQVGFLWSSNWTFVFMVFLPLFFMFVTELLAFWKDEGRIKLVPEGDRMESNAAWAGIVEASSYSYWAVFLICLLFAGVFQWIAVCLIPLVKGGDKYVTDWSKLVTVHPEIISVPEEVVFTSLAYLYMSLCFYLFFAGLILLFSVVDDLWRLGGGLKIGTAMDYPSEVNEVGLRVMRVIFRCTLLGVLMGITMKLQSAYLTSSGNNIVSWLLSDILSSFNGRNDVSYATQYRMPTQYSSLLVVISTCVVFLQGSIRLGVGSRFQVPFWKMSAVVVILVAGYLLIGAFTGFSILLGAGVLLAIYGLFDPGFWQWGAS